MTTYIKYGFLVFLMTFFQSKVISQELSIVLGPEKIAENQSFTITIQADNAKITNYSEFPEIEGFRMRGTSKASSSQIINGQISSSQSITMAYVPNQQGVYILKPFKILVNGEELSSKGQTITVGPATSRQQSKPFDHDPFDKFFGEKDEGEYFDIEDDAFLALSTDKKEVYIGEAVNADLSFYVSDENKAPLEFYELGRQLSGILKDLKPGNCWEENFNIENINGEPVRINGKNYTQYKIYEASYYPFNTDSIVFPSVGLKMIKYKMARKPSFFGNNKKEDYKTFYSRKKIIKVKDLPPHPLKDKVAVGEYRLEENLSESVLETGKSFKYEFSIYGEGNISSIEKPVVPNDDIFDMYPPSVSQNVNRRNGKVVGNKTFSYYAIPNEPGNYKLEDYFKWIYFSPRKNQYDTLNSKYMVRVEGESLVNETIIASDMGSFYDKIEISDNSLARIGNFEWISIFSNLLILVSLIFSAILIFKK